MQAQALREFSFLALRYPITAMATVDHTRRANLAWLAARAGGVRALSAQLGKAESQVSQWINASPDSKTGKPRGMSSNSCREIETMLKLDPGWMDEQHLFAGEEPAPYSVAQDMSYSKVEHAPLLIWGTEMLADGTFIFWVALPDDSMAPRAPQGKLICFDTRMTPRRGDGVIVRETAGTLYFRVYRPGAGGRFTAHAINPDFDALDSERDGLEVVAVLKSEEGRWG